RRELDPERLTVVDEQRRVDTRFTGESPFAGAPAAELQELGYVRETPDGSFDYYGPDAHVLLSDVFLDSHCFRVHTDDPPEPGWVGLAFEPVERGGVSDVEGVLWVDAATSELRRLDFDYTWLPAGLRDDRMGGLVDFERIPEGPWMVRRWAIRMPVVGLRRSYAFGMEGREEPYLMRATETGGEVMEVNLQDGSPLIRTRTATLTRTVFDSIAGEPLEGATVRLAGTDFSAVTGPVGRFRLDGLPDGSYGVVFDAERLEGIPWSPAPVTVRLEAGAEATVDLAVPSRERVLAEGCRVTATEDGTSVVTGRAVAPAGAGIPAGAEVVLSWQRFELSNRQREGVAVGERISTARVALEEDGRFSVCG
ncbi:MAG TPA: carboxypeptidase regulatory-like domain-containing protein, partial [Longimicrobiales bacterium]|nr:carboxypeptidase regulatory-like domain-containing protein [Longimicrobiales bacterium]